MNTSRSCLEKKPLYLYDVANILAEHLMQVFYSIKKTILMVKLDVDHYCMISNDYGIYGLVENFTFELLILSRDGSHLTFVYDPSIAWMKEDGLDLCDQAYVLIEVGWRKKEVQGFHPINWCMVRRPCCLLM